MIVVDTPADVVLSRAWSSGLSAYDCEYVAIARSVGVPLVTFERQVVRLFPRDAKPASAFG